jgi:hypothetical protein
MHNTHVHFTSENNYNYEKTDKEDGVGYPRDGGYIAVDATSVKDA